MLASTIGVTALHCEAALVSMMLDETIEQALAQKAAAALALLCSLLFATLSTNVLAELNNEQDRLIERCNSWQLADCAQSQYQYTVGSHSNYRSNYHSNYDNNYQHSYHDNSYHNTIVMSDFYREAIEGEIYSDAGEGKIFRSISFKSTRQYLMAGLKKRVKKLRALTSPLDEEEKGSRLYMDLESDGAALTFQINY